ncbi:MAG TPA: hypothetical protein VFC16_18560 [Nakamurella sp.]|nr:hypothetical protein [Nakamurella sp.]
MPELDDPANEVADHRTADVALVPARNSPEGSTDRLDQVVRDLESLDRMDIGEHVATYGRMHTALTDALTRTADSGAPPDPGR